MVLHFFLSWPRKFCWSEYDVGKKAYDYRRFFVGVEDEDIWSLVRDQYRRSWYIHSLFFGMQSLLSFNILGFQLCQQNKIYTKLKFGNSAWFCDKIKNVQWLFTNNISCFKKIEQKSSGIELLGYRFAHIKSCVRDA